MCLGGASALSGAHMGVSAESQPGPGGPAASGLRGLAKARRRQLVEQWRTLYRSEPPRKIPSCWLQMAVAFRLQERAHGPLKPTTQRLLLQYGNPAGSRPAARSTKVAPGTALVREWQGVNHTVTVLDKGVSYDGKLYRSLTAVADAITGAHWSGPEFFGLNGKRGVVRNDQTSR